MYLYVAFKIQDQTEKSEDVSQRVLTLLLCSSNVIKREGVKGKRSVCV